MIPVNKKTIRPARVHAAGFAAALAALVLAAVPAGAFQLVGKVVNGTTGRPVSEATITLVNPSGGMMVERQVKTLDETGRYEVDDLSDDAPAYLARVAYKGVNYTEMIRYHGHDPVTQDIEVFEPTTSWDGVMVSVPHVVLARSQDTLTVQKFIQVANNTSPPKTVYGEEARFRLHLPGDMIALNTLSVTSLGIPLPMTPEPTGEPGIYTIDYPIKPGGTRIDLSFDVPYTNDAYRYKETVTYDMSGTRIITEDPTLVVSGAGVERTEDFHGFAAYMVGDLARGASLEFDVRGGASSPAAPPKVLLMPNRTQVPALTVMILLTLVLLGAMATAAGRPHSDAAKKEALLAQKGDLLDQMAKLDDLHKTGTVSEQVYKIKRGELKSALAEIYYQLDFKKDREQPVRREGAARV